MAAKHTPKLFGLEQEVIPESPVWGQQKRVAPICSDFPILFRSVPICIPCFLDLFRYVQGTLGPWETLDYKEFGLPIVPTPNRTRHPGIPKSAFRGPNKRHFGPPRKWAPKVNEMVQSHPKSALKCPKTALSGLSNRLLGANALSGIGGFRVLYGGQ